MWLLLMATNEDNITVPRDSGIEKIVLATTNIERAKEEANEVVGRLAAIGQALAKVTAQDAVNWYAACGYSII